MHFQNEGRAVVLLGGLGSTDDIHFGGTQYAKVILDRLWGLPPAIDMAYEKHVHQAVRKIVGEGLAESAHDLSDGGLAIALAESSFNESGIGAHVKLESNLRPEFLLFHEGPSRILLSTADADRIHRIARENDVECVTIGVTMKARLQIDNLPLTLVDHELNDLRNTWENGLERHLHQS